MPWRSRFVLAVQYPVVWGMGLLSAGISFFGALTQEEALAYGAAVVALTAVVLQPLINVYHKIREASRLEASKDRETNLTAFESEVRKRVEVELELKALKVEYENMKRENELIKRELKKLREAQRNTAHRVDKIENQTAGGSGVILTPGD